jgi:hypothetical protein
MKHDWGAGAAAMVLGLPAVTALVFVLLHVVGLV